MFYVGLDLGQRRDHSAIVVVQPTTHAVLVRHLERIPLGTPYPRVVDRIRDIVEHPELAGRCSLAVDGTGVGAPVVEMLRSARLGCNITAVTITGGEREHAYYAAGGFACNVPKQDLIAGVQVLLENGELQIAKELKEAGALVRELLSMRAESGRQGRVRIGADGYAEHDDLVVALALACWSSRQISKQKKWSVGVRRLTGI